MDTTKNFVERWKNHGYERGESQKFWIDLLETLGVQNVSEKIFFEQKVKGKYIDAVIPSMRVLIEQKSLGKNLSDAYIQAKNYDNELPFDKKSRWIICSDFQTFELYDMNKENPSPTKFLLKDLSDKLDEFKVFLNKNADGIPDYVKISLQAGEIVKKLYNALRKNYLNPDSAESLQSLNKLCVRLVFCLYAESTGILGDKKIFRNYLNKFPASHLRKILIELFKILDTKISDRAPYLEEDLKKFPYVNGNLFSEEIEIPNFNDEIKFFLLEYASRNFDWSGISPTIFGAVFESTLNPATRRTGGMHYTSIENIHKVIDPLFLDDLREEFNKCKTRKQLLTFQDKLASLKFFDPACGSGNFLTETYLSLRKLENEVLKKLMGEQIQLGELDNPIKVSINQFYGVEINDFAVAVAKTALWIAELQMLDETQKIIHKNLNPLPLKNFANIFEGNALRLDWQNICPQADFIIGNPPFVGKKEQNSRQKIELREVFYGEKNINNLDYVACWYMKSVKFMQNTKIKAAFVSTSSVTQGEQIPTLWEILLKNDINVIFAYQNFQWKSESVKQANVRCVIIGFVVGDYNREKKIFTDSKIIIAQNINPYLVNAPNIIVKACKKNLFGAKKIIYGNMPIDNGNLILSDDEVKKLLRDNPANKNFVRHYIGGDELIHKTYNRCLWLKDISPEKFSKSKIIMQHIKATKIFREQSNRSQTKKAAEFSWLFGEIRQPDSTMLVIPKVTGGSRKYIPMAFIEPEIIVSGSALIVPNADLYDFGVLTSSVHMSWLRTVGGYFGTSYQYSASMVYNTFPFCNPSPEQKNKIEQTAQNILDCRKNYPDASLADLYDPLLMPADLRDAHKKNDAAVLAAYGFENLSEEEILSELMILHKNLTK